MGSENQESEPWREQERWQDQQGYDNRQSYYGEQQYYGQDDRGYYGGGEPYNGGYGYNHSSYHGHDGLTDGLSRASSVGEVMAEMRANAELHRCGTRAACELPCSAPRLQRGSPSCAAAPLPAHLLLCLAAAHAAHRPIYQIRRSGPRVSLAPHHAAPQLLTVHDAARPCWCSPSADGTLRARSPASVNTVRACAAQSSSRWRCITQAPWTARVCR